MRAFAIAVIALGLLAPAAGAATLDGPLRAPEIAPLVTGVPVADLQIEDASVGLGDSIVLSGVGSTDSDGKIIEYRWTVGGRSVVATDESSFKAPGFSEPGRYTASLVVVDDDGNESTADEVDFFVLDDVAPTAVLSAPTSVGIGDTIALSGTQSTDVGGEVAEYRWTVGSRTVVVTDTATFNAPGFSTPGSVTVRLVVVDDSGNQSSSVQRQVVVVDDIAPTAVLDVPSAVGFGDPIPLSGEDSVDTGGTIVSYRWTVAGRPVVETATDTFDAPAGLPVGRHTASLVVVDSAGNVSNADSAQFVVIDDIAPTAALDAPELVTPGQQIPLSGARSTDIPGEIIEYRWTVSNRSVVATDEPTFNSPAGLPNGLHNVTLVVVDDSGNQSNPVTETVEIGPDNRAPTAVLDGPAAVGIGDPIPLSGERSTDVGGKVVRYRWTVAGQVIETADSTFNAPSLPVGRHTLSLVVSDDSGNESSPVTRDVIVRDDEAPTAILDAPASVTAGAAVPLSGARSPDVGGSVVRYIWTVAGRAPVETADPTFNAPGLPAGRHTVSLVVVDDAGNQSNADTKQIDAVAPSAPPQPPIGKRLASFGSTILIAPAGKANSQIDLGQGTLLAGRIFAPVATSLTADFSAPVPTAGASKAARSRRVSLGRKSLTVPAGGVARLQVKLSKRARKAIARKRTLKVRMRAVTRELDSGAKTTTTRTLTFKVSR